LATVREFVSVLLAHQEAVITLQHCYHASVLTAGQRQSPKPVMDIDTASEVRRLVNSDARLTFHATDNFPDAGPLRLR